MLIICYNKWRIMRVVAFLTEFTQFDKILKDAIIMLNQGGEFMETQERNGFSIVGFIAQVLIILLFVFVLMWLFPTKSYLESNFANNGNVGAGAGSNSALSELLFNQNLLSMKDAAKEYFTVKRMPSTNGSSKTLKLGEMINNSMVVELVDANGNKCDRDASYVKVTKVDSEYEMEVSLTCGKVTKTIKTTIGCYNYCESGLCEKKGTEVTLYQYSKTTKGTSKWSNWSEWSKTAVTKTSTREVETKTVNEKTGTNVVTTKAKTTTTYSCPDGYELSEDKKTCTGKAKTIDAIAEIVYTCSDGYELSEDKKTCIGKAIITNAKSKNNNICPDGYELSEDKTVCTSKVVTDAQKEYYCVDGEQRGNQCYLGQRREYEYSKTVCNNGYLSNDKTKCVTETPVRAATLGRFTSLDACKQLYGDCKASGKTGFALYCKEGHISYYYENQCVTRTDVDLCPAGWELTKDKTQCQREYFVDNLIPARERYTCKTGELQGTQCISISTVEPTKKVEYSCAAGTGELQGTKCVLIPIVKPTEKIEYSCKTGKLSDNKCILTSIVNSIKNVEYSCDKDTKLNDKNLCEKTVDVFGDVTYYRYRTYTTTKDTVVYKWSESNNDSSLLKAGYKLTGKTKTTISK